MKNKLTVLIVLLSVTVLGIIGVILFEVNKLVTINQKMVSLMQISELANSIRSETYYYRMEFWEYVAEPTPTRLAVFNEADQKINITINTFSNLIHGENAQVYPGGVAYAEEIISKSEQLTPLIGDVLDKANQYQITQSASELSVIRSKLWESMFVSEKGFDNFEIDKGIEEFTLAQTKYGAQMGAKLTETTNLIRLLDIILAGLYLGLLVVIAVWLRSIIVTINRNEKKYD